MDIVDALDATERAVSTSLSLLRRYPYFSIYWILELLLHTCDIWIYVLRTTSLLLVYFLLFQDKGRRQQFSVLGLCICFDIHNPVIRRWNNILTGFLPTRPVQLSDPSNNDIACSLLYFLFCLFLFWKLTESTKTRTTTSESHESHALAQWNEITRMKSILRSRFKALWFAVQAYRQTRG